LSKQQTCGPGYRQSLSVAQQRAAGLPHEHDGKCAVPVMHRCTLLIDRQYVWAWNHLYFEETL
jgi:hypothetical protein